MAEPNYASDLNFLNSHTSIIELSGGDARVAVAPDFQGRVMTSSLAGEGGTSFGWLNRSMIEAGQDNPKFNNYGGEDRFWLGPEAGQFGLWFEGGQAFTLDNWHTPPGLNTGRFEITSQGPRSVAMATNFDITNYSGTSFRCAVKRTIDLLDEDKAIGLLGATVPGEVRMVAFASWNLLANVGEESWTRDGGLLSIWTLGQFKPLARGWVIVPVYGGSPQRLGPIVTSDYFGPLGADRCKVFDDHVLFACDGQFRSKIGISPSRARDVLGSYDPDAEVLTIVQFNLPAGARRLPYVNSLWQQQENPFAGDAVNSYNDGEETPGGGQLGPFYEIETSSPAAELAPGQSLTHVHRTFHFHGPYESLDKLAIEALGVSLREIA
jgi:hypothetical protein